MKTTIKEQIQEKIGKDYVTLYEDFMKKHQKARRAFYVLESTIKIKNYKRYATGIKIEKYGNKYQAYQHRQLISGCCYEVV
jgi:hypothetical protein